MLKPAPFKTQMTQFFLGLVVLYLLVLAAMYFYQRRLLYHPERGADSPAEFQLPMQKVSFSATDGVRLAAWYARAPEGRPTILYFHGNAGRLGSRPGKFRTLMEAGFGLLAVSYRGFGESEGAPTEEGLYNDARGAIAYLAEQGVQTRDIVLYGESLGTGVAVQMGLEHPELRALVLEAAYRSVGARGQEIYPFIPVGLLLKDAFDTQSKIGALTVPVLFLHGLKDATMPAAHTRALVAQTKARHEVHYYEEVAHSDYPLEDVALRVRRFVDALR